MADFVIRRDRTQEPFDEDKIRKAIMAAAKQAGLSEDRIKEVVEAVSTKTIQLADQQNEISTTDLRDEILKDLDEMEPSVSKAWREYDKKAGKT